MRRRRVPPDRRRDGGRRIGGVLLAAGKSTRFGDANKLLATVDDVQIIRRAAEALRAAAVDETVAVLGHDAPAVAAALEPLGVETRVNDAYAEGQSTSVATGVEVARERDWDAAVFALGDMPFVDPATVDALVEAYADGAGTVLAPSREARRGNPVLFDARHYDALADVEGDRGGRELVESVGTLVPVDDPGIHRDVDRPEDLDGNE